MMTSKIKTLLSLAFIAMSATVAAQKQFTLEDVISSGNNYYNMSPKNKYSTWWGEQLVHTDLETCSTVDAKTGKEEALFSLDDINKSTEDERYRSLMNATFPYADQPLVLLNNGHKRVLVNWRKHTVEWSQPSDNEHFADWNAKSRTVAFVKDDNLFVKGEDTKQLTTDGSRDIVYGQSVHRDEFGIYKGTFWSNSGYKLAFYRMDQSMVSDFPLVNNDAREAEAAPIKYPMAGMTSHKVTVGVYDLKTGKTIYLNVGDPTDRYFTNIQWSPDDDLIYLIELNRDQTDMSLDAYDASTGEKVRTLYTEHNDKYVHPMTPITFLPWDKTQFILQSERDGYNHLYLYNTKGEFQKQLTSGKWVVLDLMGFNVKTHNAIIMSTECSAIQNNMFAVNVKTGKRTLLDNGRGCHANVYEAGGGHKTALSPQGQWIYDQYSEPDVPRNIDIINTATAKRVSYFKADDPWKGYNAPEFSCGTIKADDGTTDLYYRMVKPVNFDPAKKYPVIVYVYGGPGVRLVEARWHYMSRGWETYMAQKGYLMFILDSRGSTDRGRDFEQVTFRHLGVQEMKDQLRGVEYLKSLPYVDASRMGVQGWSYGGFMTTSLMCTYPDVFKVGAAGGPVIDWKWYEVMYGERYMDTPQSNPEGYKESSLINKAKNLKGKLQIITGLNDPTVVPQNAISFIHECIKQGKQPDFFVYPGEPHNVRGHMAVHLYERLTEYFETNLR